MAKWKNRGFDKLEKTGKMRRGGHKSQRAGNADTSFEKSEEQWGEVLEQQQGFKARVVEVHKRHCFVSTEPEHKKINTRDVWLATLARKFLLSDRLERNFVVVGDKVLCTPSLKQKTVGADNLPLCVVQQLAPRQSKLSRLDPHSSRLEHVLASNMDQLLIVASVAKPRVKWGLIDRYLVLAEREEIEPIIVLNKKDLLESEKDEFLADFLERVETYKKIGYTVILCQANSPKARKEPAIIKLKALLGGQITLLSGHSGVGKSSLVNLFDPEIVQLVEPDEDIFYKGRHTTTFASFIKLGTGGYVIDTPGIRSFTFEEFNAIDLTHCFREMRPYLGKCKFRECRHIDEPECVIQSAVASGEISEHRYRSYLAILSGASGREGRIRDLDMEEIFEENVMDEEE